MEAPETRYTRSGGVHIAYQVFGGGGRDLVFLAEFWNSIEAMWEQPDYHRFLERLGSFARVICIDQRGTGHSLVRDEPVRRRSGRSPCGPRDEPRDR